jgi:ABC-type Fe3+-siderophore transport system permease subunit
MGAVATCVLPGLYALLGACAFLLRSFQQQFKGLSFNPDQDVHFTRFVVAAIGGTVVGLFNTFNISQNTTIPPLAIAFLVGYAVDVFFTFLESLLQTFARPGNVGSQRPQTQSTPKRVVLHR